MPYLIEWDVKTIPDLEVFAKTNDHKDPRNRLSEHAYHAL
jgi:hypothetical protein